jgi:hypothetical protein
MLNSQAQTVSLSEGIKLAVLEDCPIEKTRLKTISLLPG